MYDVVIIDPASSEFNRGSFCYQPYIFYSYLKSEGKSVLLLEDFTCVQIDRIPKAKNYYVSLWSYPQIEACLVLDRFMEVKPKFFGYRPLIEKYFLEKKLMSDEEIKIGIKTYVEYFKDFIHLLLSDCDLHLKKYGEGKVYPLFTSYGCPNMCSFCPVGVNCNRKRVISSDDVVYKVLDYCCEQGYKNIHFTDEDFFFDVDRAYRILEYAVGKDMKFISLGEVRTVLKFIDKYGQDILEKSGMKLIEVGFETGSIELAKKMKKPGVSDYIRLAESVFLVDIFWLTLTFFPGETIRTLNDTGDFLRKYGFNIKDLYGRISTNSTRGGLGQFFQLYEGVRDFDSLKEAGKFLTSRPMRLIPSFIPYSFLNSVVNEIREVEAEEVEWYSLYGIDALKYDFFEKGKTIGESMKNNVGKCSLGEEINYYLHAAISARLGVIK